MQKIFFKFCHENLTFDSKNEVCEHKKRVVFFVDKTKRQQEQEKLQTVKEHSRFTLFKVFVMEW